MAGTDANDPVPGADASQRIYSACIACQKRKKRCDGVRPTCGLCARLDSPCVFTERKVRGPGKNRQNVQKLDERLKQLQSSDITNGISGAKGTTSQAHEDTLDARPRGQLGDQPSSSLSSTNQSSSEYESSRATTSRAADYRSDPTAFGFSQFKAALQAARQQVEHQSNTSPFPRTIFNSLPSYVRVSELFSSAWDDLPFHSLLFTLDHAQHLVEQQFRLDPDQRGGEPSRWAIVNSLFASALLYKCTDDFFHRMFIPAWGYFKNAFAMLPELMIRGADISACEAILAMAMFSRQTADVRVTSQLASAAARLVHTLGLHKSRRSSAPKNSSSQEIERERRVYLVAYILEAEMAHKYGLPSTFKSCDMNVLEVSPGATSSPRLPKHLLMMAGLASLRLRLHEMHPSEQEGLMRQEHMQVLISMKRLLDEWYRSLSGDMEAFSGENAPHIHMKHMHLTYLTIAMQISMILAQYDEAVTSSDDTQDIPNENMLVGSSIRSPWEDCVSDAHQVILSLRDTSSRPCFVIWELLCYPLASTLVLLSAVFKKPDSASQTHVDRIEDFIKLLQEIQSNGSDVHRLLLFCQRIHSIASLAIDDAQKAETTFPGTGAVAKLESFRQKLSGVDECLHLAQGLLSNMPSLRTYANDVFGGIFGEVSPSELYGMCVPAILRSQDQTFAFGS